MEAVILLFRRLFSIPEPEFQLILDRDILIDHEIDDNYAFDFEAANAFFTRMGKEQAGEVAGNGHRTGNVNGNGHGNGNGNVWNGGQQMMMGAGLGAGMGVIGELSAVERRGDQMSVAQTEDEDDTESEASSR